MEYSEAEAQKAGKKMMFSISTNGVLLDQGTINFFTEHNVGVQVSIDGNAASQNFNRPLSDGSPSYNVVIENSKALIKSQGKVTARITVSNKTIGQMEDNAQHLLQAGFHSVHIEHAAGVWDSEELINSKAGFSKMNSHMNGFVNNNYEEKENPFRGINNVVKFIDLLHKRGKRLYACGAGRGYLCVDITGNIYLCHRLSGNKKHLIGNVVDETINIEYLKEVENKIYVMNKGKCSKCWAKFLCGGDCIAVAEEINNDVAVPDSLKCSYNKQFMKNTIIFYASLPVGKREKLFKTKV